ncbi:hypothetical protein EKO04_006062 [Ascochyta lentis]|uniref:Uncharacterized protein n=1 Tax=Ascochyta lentis TaxID=205686 RepID=A0A8H7MH24_9PLEO|nr:hypothetical protein EKO04_006062 [Ascochyta lentis]
MERHKRKHKQKERKQEKRARKEQDDTNENVEENNQGLQEIVNAEPIEKMKRVKSQRAAIEQKTLAEQALLAEAQKRDAKLKIPSRYNNQLQYMLAGLTKTHTPNKPGKGNSGVATNAGEELWVTYYKAAESKTDGVKGRVYGYVIRNDQEHMASLLALDYSKISSDIVYQAVQSTGKANPIITPKTFTQYARPVWFGQGFKLSKAAKRPGGVNPYLTRQRNKGRVVQPRIVADNDITMPIADARKIIKAYASRGDFDDGMYEQLRAAVQLYRGTEHQPSKQTLQDAKVWAEKRNESPFKYSLYMKWETGQVRNLKQTKKKKKAETWQEKFQREDFTIYDLSLEDLSDLLAELYRYCTQFRH